MEGITHIRIDDRINPWSSSHDVDKRIRGYSYYGYK